MMSVKQFRSLKAAGKFYGLNEYDGDVVIEVWKYQPIAHKESLPDWVDQLSLAISLKENTDPRVEGELIVLIGRCRTKTFRYFRVILKDIFRYFRTIFTKTFT